MDPLYKKYDEKCTCELRNVGSIINDLTSQYGKPFGGGVQPEIDSLKILKL